MSLSKAQLTTFASTICHADHDTTTFSQFFNDVIDELGKLPSPVFAEYAFEAVVSGTAEYSFETAMLKPIAIFFGDTLIPEVSEQALEAYSATQQSDTGDPVAFTLENVDARKYRLYPIPDANGTASTNWAAGFAAAALALIFVEDRATDIEDYHALPITFDCLAREFAYPSDHQDIAYAKVCAELAQLLYVLAGVTK